jgi:hypothetical protein
MRQQESIYHRQQQLGMALTGDDFARASCRRAIARRAQLGRGIERKDFQLADCGMNENLKPILAALAASQNPLVIASLRSRR